MSDKPLTDISFSSFDLHPSLQAGLESAGFTRCTPIQAMALPVALEGGDVAGQAQTGTGKTLAFLVATMNRLMTRPALAERNPEDPRALILAPTRELAIQIHKDAAKLGSDLGLKLALVYGGVDYDKQRALLQAGADIIIATPGRLIDYVKQHKVVSLHACEVCVLDEADRMFDLGFIKDIRFLLRRMPIRTERQTLLFSATLSHRVLELAYEHMNEPQKMVVETESITAAKVRQKMYFPADEEKLPLLLGLLSRGEGGRTLVFVNTKVFVERVARALERAGYRVGVLSGDVPQKKRESLLARFQKGQLEILVATDVAARGLHIDAVKYVYNYDLPFDAEDYVHRIGRTARLGEEGDAISFACERYAMSLPEIEAYIEQKIPTAPVEADLLVARPRPERAQADDGEGESVSAIFREAREQRAAEEERRGGGRRSGGGGREGGRGEGGRARRPRRSEPSAKTEGAGEAAAGAETQAPTAASTPVVTGGEARSDAGHGDGARKDGAGQAPRKRRRRRGGRGGASGEAGGSNAAADTGAGNGAAPAARGSASAGAPEGGQVQAGRSKPKAEKQPAQSGQPATGQGTRTPADAPSGKPADAPSGNRPGLLSRIRRRLEGIAGRNPQD